MRLRFWRREVELRFTVQRWPAKPYSPISWMVSYAEAPREQRFSDFDSPSEAIDPMKVAILAIGESVPLERVTRMRGE